MAILLFTAVNKISTHDLFVIAYTTLKENILSHS